MRILYIYTVRRVMYADEYRACIWTSLGGFRYERYDSVYTVRHPIDCIRVLLSQYNYDFFIV